MKRGTRHPQLIRFCLCGFLKNQLYLEPLLILAFREKGLSFTAIGSLIAFGAEWHLSLQPLTKAAAQQGDFSPSLFKSHHV
jgi:hypothetical protein